jgi:hypothetical protein
MAFSHELIDECWFTSCSQWGFFADLNYIGHFQFPPPRPPLTAEQEEAIRRYAGRRERFQRRLAEGATIRDLAREEAITQIRVKQLIQKWRLEDTEY